MTRFFYAQDIVRPEDLIPRLARGERHWRKGYSAYELASAWIGAGGIPPTVRAVLDTCPDYRAAELVEGLFEREVDLRTPGGAARPIYSCSSTPPQVTPSSLSRARSRNLSGRPWPIGMMAPAAKRAGLRPFATCSGSPPPQCARCATSFFTAPSPPYSKRSAITAPEPCCSCTPSARHGRRSGTSWPSRPQSVAPSTKRGRSRPRHRVMASRCDLPGSPTRQHPDTADVPRGRRAWQAAARTR